MNTWKRTARLLKRHAVPVGLGVSLGLGLTGCSATSGQQRTGAASKMKTFLSVGDKPLPVVTGEPGSTVAAETVTGPDSGGGSTRRRARADGRISGRVFDADNRPVPDARVRLAVSGAAGGKVVSATTDRSGAFTLHGLRPGTEYTVIAETEGDSGPLTGRADARTSDTDVRIGLGTADESTAAASNPSRVNRVSDRAASDDPAPSAVNEEDLPPAREAEAMNPETAPPSERRAPESTPTQKTSGRRDPWRRGSTPAGPDAAPVDPEARGTGAPVDGVAPLPPDDGENPLPPALEPTPDPSASLDPDRTGAEEPDGTAKDPDPFPPGSGRVAVKAPDPFEGLDGSRPSHKTRRPAASSPFESPTRPTEVARATPPDDTAPGALVVVPDSFGPVVSHDADPFAGAHPDSPEPSPSPSSTPTPKRPKLDLKGSSWPLSSTTTRVTRPRRATPTDEPPRPTWGQVVASAGPPVSTDAAPTAEPTPPDTRDARHAVATRDDASARPVRASRAVRTSFVKSECEYDERLRRIIDFRLPDLDGKTVRFQDLDADLVLIDFWGTWCPPCIKSLPHLVELQERMGSRLKVIGIACEPEAPQVASAKVAETARKQNINYPVLLSRNDGTCPLQEALHVQAFPTMVLVDRQGRVLWRDQGATPATLARLDRFIDSSSAKGDEVRRY